MRLVSSAELSGSVMGRPVTPVYGRERMKGIYVLIRTRPVNRIDLRPSEIEDD